MENPNPAPAPARPHKTPIQHQQQQQPHQARLKVGCLAVIVHGSWAGQPGFYLQRLSIPRCANFQGKVVNFFATNSIGIVVPIGQPLRSQFVVHFSIPCGGLGTVMYFTLYDYADYAILYCNCAVARAPHAAWNAPTLTQTERHGHAGKFSLCLHT